MLLKVVLFILVIYYLFKLIGSVFGSQRSRPAEPDNRNVGRREGDVRVERNNNLHSAKRHDEGEYADYEEIE